ncbi:MAG: hypothetical protein J6Z04_05150 [Clostridia bacterium]|nr:hypothetical protein [Clostridia bacterium]
MRNEWNRNAYENKKEDKHMQDLGYHATKHSVERVKERFGIKNDRASERIVRLALERGIRMSQFRSKYERTYLAGLCREEGIEPIVYRDFIFICNLKTNVCITAYPVPQGFDCRRFKKAMPDGDVKRSA